VITEGEYDAMAVHQETGLPAISLPNGCRSLPVELLPLLERFEDIYLWMDNDIPGQEVIRHLPAPARTILDCFSIHRAQHSLPKSWDLVAVIWFLELIQTAKVLRMLMML
jgi:hypothetical protein